MICVLPLHRGGASRCAFPRRAWERGDTAMNLKTTLVLLVLTAAGAAWFYSSPSLPSWLGTTPGTGAAPSGTLAVLENDLKPDALKRVEIRRADGPIILEKG